MKQELIGPTAALTVAILARYKSDSDELPNNVISSAFAQAYQALLEGMQRVDQENPPEQGQASVEPLRM
ncbi:hypothetical protein SAMN05216344_102198 [Polaromonas sp. OV174]|uniref:hypothetical protein n=1 Tax=Polaromonas sp. OV174 TaxID=1855300 RepID=UPI0008E1A366|nr:hypothetical protein [Polaromonas sp. OV174]SFB74501.1 hypothetical protein SAMN05216344_102198 [Polaromonas sp. OV174]